MPNNNNVIDLTTNCITSENYIKARHTDYYIGDTKKQHKQKNSTSTKKSLQTSLSLYKALKTQRRYAPSKTMRNCGLTLTTEVNGSVKPVVCDVKKQGVTVSGVGFCRSPFCVTCMGYTRTKRMDRITNGLRQARAEGLQAYFVTFTIQRTHDIKQQSKDLLYGWKCFLDKISYRFKKQGIKKYIVRNLDITFRPDQKDIYHTHLHCIIVLDKDIEPFKDKKTKTKILDTTMFFEHAWVDIQTSKNVKASLEGQHIEKIKHDAKLSRYVSKFEGLSKELTNFAHKTGKENKIGLSSIGFMELLGHVHKNINNEDDKHKYIYRDFLKAMKGARTVSFSRTWKELEERAPEDEESEESTEEQSMSVHIPLLWFKLIGRDFDKFCLCLHIAFLTQDMSKIYYLLDSKPSELHLKHIFLYFGMLNL
jgi:hypothetical protein